MSLLGFLGNVATGFLAGGPVGAAVGAVKGSGILSQSAPKAGSPLINIANAVKQIAAPAAKYSSPQVALTAPFASGSLPIPSMPGGGVQIDSTKTSGVQLFPGTFAGTQTVYTSPAGGKGPPGPGYHLNRSGYYTKHGYVPKHSVWVKNRRRNPLNPRALSRSMSRIHSAKRAVHFLDRIHIGPKRARRK